MPKRIFMIAGPNGAGKTTTAFSTNPYLLDIYEFLNADEIAKGLAPLHPESMQLTASKLMIQRLKEFLKQDKNFAFETTAAGTNYIKYLQEAKERNYQINLLFLWLSSPELAVKRVQQRVAQGGHNIPKDTIIRRYHLGLKNLFKYYLDIADSVMIIDNSLSGRLVFEKLNNSLKIHEQKIWEKITSKVNG
jgi:predicted ABC-type ATPase